MLVKNVALNIWDMIKITVQANGLAHHQRSPDKYLLLYSNQVQNPSFSA